jgi:hypothetical protein
MAHAPEIVRRQAHIAIATISELQKLLGANAASIMFQKE